MAQVQKSARRSTSTSRKSSSQKSVSGKERKVPVGVQPSVPSAPGPSVPRQGSSSYISPVVRLPSETVDPSGNTSCCGGCLVFLSWMFIIFTFPFSIWCCIKCVNTFERAVVFRLGRIYGGPQGPGVVFINPFIDTFCVIDMRTQNFDVPPQEVLSKDHVTVTIDAVLYFRITQIIPAVVNVVDAYYSTKLLCQTMLRNTLGTKTLAEMLSDRVSISQHLKINLDKATDPWGVLVERIEIKDVRLPKELQRAMAAEAEATRLAKAKVVAAEGELKASSALKAAADTMAESSGAMQLRYLQTMTTIAQERKTTIIFPFPMESIFS